MRPLIVLCALIALIVPAAAAPASTIVVDETWKCTGPVDIDLVKVTISGGGGDGISLGTNCSGRIGRVEVDIVYGSDGIKVQNSSPDAAHDLVIESGYVNCIDHPPTAHQDGMQAMGGGPILFKNLTVNCQGALGAFAISEAGSRATRPHDIVCEGCNLGPIKGLRIGNSLRSGARNSAICGTSITAAATSPVNENNTDGCGGPPPPPPPPPPPEPTIGPLYPKQAVVIPWTAAAFPGGEVLVRITLPDDTYKQIETANDGEFYTTYPKAFSGDRTFSVRSLDGSVVSKPYPYHVGP